ncbi:hypothetical protein [Bacillus manliponensis]|nr:hypothetical protein [Bacillus manliponensis]
MKNITIKVLGLVAVFTLAIGVYSPVEKSNGPVKMLVEHGNGGG